MASSDRLAEALATAAKQGPPMSGPFFTLQQAEARHPATRGRLRRWVLHADAGVTGYEGLRSAVIRVGRCVMFDESLLIAWLRSHAAQPPSPARNPHGRAGKKQRKRGR